MSSEIRKNITAENTWVRLLFMLIFVLLHYVAKVVIGAVIVFQFFTVLFTGHKNEKLLTFGQELSTYIYQIFRFLTFNSDEKAFPFSDWPKQERKDESSTGV